MALVGWPSTRLPDRKYCFALVSFLSSALSPSTLIPCLTSRCLSYPARQNQKSKIKNHKSKIKTQRPKIKSWGKSDNICPPCNKRAGRQQPNSPTAQQLRTSQASAYSPRPVFPCFFLSFSCLSLVRGGLLGPHSPQKQDRAPLPSIPSAQALPCTWDSLFTSTSLSLSLSFFRSRPHPPGFATQRIRVTPSLLRTFVLTPPVCWYYRPPFRSFRRSAKAR